EAPTEDPSVTEEQERPAEEGASDTPAAEPPEPLESEAPLDANDDFGSSEPFVLEPSRLTAEEEARLLSELRRYRGPFAQGRLRISVLFGGGSNFRTNYLILGAGVGYYV